MNKVRAKFEAWIRQWGFSLSTIESAYADRSVECRWQAWQAATESARGGAEPFAYCFTDVNGQAKELCSGPTADDNPRDTRIVTPLYTQPPAPVVPDPLEPSISSEGGTMYAHGWNACRAAMLSAAQEPTK